MIKTLTILASLSFATLANAAPKVPSTDGSIRSFKAQCARAGGAFDSQSGVYSCTGRFDEEGGSKHPVVIVSMMRMDGMTVHTKMSPGDPGHNPMTVMGGLQKNLKKQGYSVLGQSDFSERCYDSVAKLQWCLNNEPGEIMLVAMDKSGAVAVKISLVADKEKFYYIIAHVTLEGRDA